jgi:hypothetical protein
VQGKRREEIGQLEGKSMKHTGVSFWPEYSVTDDRAKVEWIVNGKRGDRVEVLARHDRAGTVRAGRGPRLIERASHAKASVASNARCRSQSRSCWAPAARCCRPRRAGSSASSTSSSSTPRTGASTTCTGLFPGADGIAQATPEQYTQVDNDGKPLPHLPPVWKGKEPDAAFPTDLPNRPFRIDAPPINMPLTVPTRDLIHKFYPQQEQINGGRNDRFVAVSDAGALAMGYYDGSKLPMWKWASEYTLADRFFMGSFGDSYINHFWLICACTPQDPNPPRNSIAQLDERGWLKRRPDSPPSALTGPASFVAGDFTDDGYSLSTNQPPYQPSRVPPAPGGDMRFADTSKGGVLPPQTQRTVGDTLSAKGISWAWYGGAWDDAVKDGMQVASAKRQIIYNNETGHPYFVVASSAVQLFRAVRTRHRRSRAASEGLHRSRCRHRTRRVAGRSRSTSRKAHSTSTRETPM